MQKKAKTATILLMIIILTSKITGFFRDIILAQTFGAGQITDAYLTALNIPVVLFDGISAALGTTFIPIYFKIKSSKGKDEVNKFTSNILNIVILISFLFVLLGIVFAPYIFCLTLCQEYNVENKTKGERKNASSLRNYNAYMFWNILANIGL